ncbi:MAG: tetratricopeptide repeat protein [Alphaproteobacteria bacterium]|nr:tetratricopeptide repeat protein [Alphaproteobacteria bacterium]MBV9063927.1 tetratricopeptide repeat protein [Alphaproteobacteria bacterium]
MFAGLFFVFGALALMAVGFACWPLWRMGGGSAAARMTLAGALGALILGIGGGAYLLLGQPRLAVRSLSGPSPNDLSGLIAVLAARVRERPHDVRGWTLLGRGYLTVQDPNDAAAAFRRALEVAPATAPPTLYSAYGEALAEAAGGAVTPDAERAFQEAVRRDPKDFAARYYLGLAYAARGDKGRALALWASLLADAPANAPWRADLIDRLAGLRRSGEAPPDVGAMVASLARRLKETPGDVEGWSRLIRAYSVLGERRKAQQALIDARSALKADRSAQARLAQEATELKLEK